MSKNRNNPNQNEETTKPTLEIKAPVQQPKREQQPVLETKVTEPVVEEVKEVKFKHTQTSMVYEMLKGYIEVMAVNRGIDTPTGVAMQRNLINQLSKFIPSQDYAVFQECMNLMIKTVKDNRETVFAKSRIFRFIPDMSGVTKVQVDIFKEVVNLLQKSADSSVEQAAQMFDIGKVVSNFNNETAVSNFTRYFKR